MIYRNPVRVIWSRWYNTSIRSTFLPRRREQLGGFVLNNSRPNSTIKTLWKYFNAPGNLTFVTCNLVTFAGFVTLNSLTASKCQKLTEIKLLEAEASISREEEEEEKEEESPLGKYTINNFWCPAKSSNLSSYDSRIAKMSLFHMLYAFYLYRDVLITRKRSGQRDEPREWGREVEFLQKGTKMECKTSCTNKDIDNFYNAWKQEFLQVFLDINKSQRFNLPTWKDYPKPLKIVCDKLYHNNMEHIEDFADFYNQIPSRGFKRLLRKWLLDYTHLVSRRPPPKLEDEKFFRQLLQDSQEDTITFNSLASILLNPKDNRRNCLLPKRDGYQIQSASIDTILLVLRGYVHQKEKMGTNHNGRIIRLLSMLKKDCVVGPADQPKRKTVRIMLPTEEQRELLDMIMTPKKRRASLALLSHHSEAIELLDSISKWNHPT